MIYRAGYKYQIAGDFIAKLADLCEFPRRGHEIDTDFIWLGDGSLLILRKGYAWDGPSGPAIDTRNFMRGSLIHDALYQLIREGHLDKNVYRILADKALYQTCRNDGMSWLRANIVYYSVRVFGNPAARPENNHKVYTLRP